MQGFELVVKYIAVTPHFQNSEGVVNITLVQTGLGFDCQALRQHVPKIYWRHLRYFQNGECRWGFTASLANFICGWFFHHLRYYKIWSIYLRLSWVGNGSFWGNKLNLLWKNATMPFSLASYSQQGKFYPQSTKIMCPPLNKVYSYSYINSTYSISQSIRNNQKPSKILPKWNNAKNISMHSSLRNVTKQLKYIFIEWTSDVVLKTGFGLKTGLKTIFWGLDLGLDQGGLGLDLGRS